jgi:hypothetical protein
MTSQQVRADQRRIMREARQPQGAGITPALDDGDAQFSCVHVAHGPTPTCPHCGAPVNDAGKYLADAELDENIGDAEGLEEFDDPAAAINAREGAFEWTPRMARALREQQRRRFAEKPVL